MLRPGFGDERATHGPFAPNADAREKTQNSQLPDIRHQGTEEGENGVPDDGEHQGAHTAELVSDGSPEKCESPAEEEEGEEETAVETSVAWRGVEVRGGKAEEQGHR
jgi:hypothetical protein